MKPIITLEDTDIFTVEADAYAHGCNVMGLMGAGIALQFRLRYPNMYKAYQKICEQAKYDGSLCGGIMPWTEDTPVIINLFTQHMTGRQARLPFVRQAFENMFLYLKDNQLNSIAMPLIGCGIGGLKWVDVHGTLLEAAKDWDGQIFVAIK